MSVERVTTTSTRVTSLSASDSTRTCPGPEGPRCGWISVTKPMKSASVRMGVGAGVHAGSPVARRDRAPRMTHLTIFVSPPRYDQRCRITPAWSTPSARALFRGTGTEPRISTDDGTHSGSAYSEATLSISHYFYYNHLTNSPGGCILFNNYHKSAGRPICGSDSGDPSWTRCLGVLDRRQLWKGYG